jgi:hypothetical protein
MLRIKQIILVLALLILSQRCAWLDKSEHIEIVNGYEVGWNDLESNRSITRKDTACEGCYHEVVGSYVYAVGHSEHLIFAKRHPTLDTAVTEYFLIDMDVNMKDPKKGITGPIDEEELKILLMGYGVDWRFDLSFPERVW